MQALTLNNLVLRLCALFAAAALLLAVNPARAQEEFTGPAPLTNAELEALVGPIALYPDDLLSVVLDASAHPLQIVAAARFLDEARENSDIQPDENWDESVVALLNYPEILDFLNEDLEWTESLGFAFLDQQTELFGAVQNFRKRAYAAGNLKSDDYQKVVVENFVIKILPAEPDTIYIPAYEPAKVVVYQPYPVFGYYPYAYPVYYYPYAPRYSFGAGFFWGVTTYFAIDWISGGYRSHYYGNYGHPYYRHTYHYRNHYYYGGRHYAGHGRQHVRHDRRHARRQSDYYRDDTTSWRGDRGGRKYARQTDHRRYRDGNRNRPRTVDGRQREQFARSDQRRQGQRADSPRTERSRDARRDNRQVAMRDTQQGNLRGNRAERRGTGRDGLQTNGQRQSNRWKQVDGNNGREVGTRNQNANRDSSRANAQRNPERWKRDTTDRGARNANGRGADNRNATNNQRADRARNSQRQGEQSRARDSRQTIGQANRRALTRTAPVVNGRSNLSRPRTYSGSGILGMGNKVNANAKTTQRRDSASRVTSKKRASAAPQTRQRAVRTSNATRKAAPQVRQQRTQAPRSVQRSQKQANRPARQASSPSARSSRPAAQRSARNNSRAGGGARSGRAGRSGR